MPGLRNARSGRPHEIGGGTGSGYGSPSASGACLRRVCGPLCGPCLVARGDPGPPPGSTRVQHACLRPRSARPSGRRLSLCHAGRKVALRAIVPPGLSRHTLRHLRAALGAAQITGNPEIPETTGAAASAAPKFEGAARDVSKRALRLSYRTLEVPHRKGAQNCQHSFEST
jgi:hypothetical protein